MACNPNTSFRGPNIAVTMGDPAGIGPEITIKALSRKDLLEGCSIAVIGDYDVLADVCHLVPDHRKLNCVCSFAELQPDSINIFDMKEITPDKFTKGAVDSACGKASYNYLIKAIRMATNGIVDAIVTNPISKLALSRAAIPFPGHTEILSHETGNLNVAMMFMLERVCVAHVTTHCSIRKALDRITSGRIMETTTLLHDFLCCLGIKDPRIAIAGLNPHAGEDGLFGTEELEIITPARVLAVQKGMSVSGPYPPDTVFMRAFKGEFDGVVSMLHDHGFVALKSRDFTSGVNITLGLPFIRTSVGHGTAFDIAGTGTAVEKSLIAAIDIGYRLAINRLKNHEGSASPI